MKSEKKIQAEIINYLKTLGAYFIKTMVTNSNGTPDIICCLDGKFLAIEVKKPDGVVSELQKHHIRSIHEAGGEAIVARSVDDLYAHLNSHSKDSLI